MNDLQLLCLAPAGAWREGSPQMIDPDELWLHVPTCVAFRAFHEPSKRGCCAQWALPAESAPTFSSNQHLISPFHSSAVDPANLRLAQRQTCSCITSRLWESDAPHQASKATSTHNAHCMYVSIGKACMVICILPVSSMFGIDELRATRLPYLSYSVRLSEGRAYPARCIGWTKPVISWYPCIEPVPHFALTARLEMQPYP